MRRTLLASLLILGLPALALADEPAPAAPIAAAPTARPPRLVGIILSSAQALLWDEDRGEYVLHKVGEEMLGGRLVELDADHIVVERGETREVLEISTPPQMRVAGRRQPKRMPALVIHAAPEVADKTAPVAAVAPAAPAPAETPVAPAAPVAAVTAPALVAPAPAAATVAPAPAASAALAAPAESVSATAAAPAPAPAPPAAPAAPAPAVAPPAAATVPLAPHSSAERKPASAIVIARAELDRELGDFAALSQDLQVSAQPEGGFRLTQVRPGCFLQRLGLRANDVVLRVDGRPINGVDDASAAYAWLRVTDKFTVEILRGGHPVTLRYAIAPTS